MKYVCMLFSLIGVATVAVDVQAAVSADIASQLGANLTSVGAERAGSQDGSIPAWDGGLPTDAGSTDEYGHMSDPFSSEEPQIVITAENFTNYRDKLSDGHLAMFRHYPASYKMLVYPSHRTASLPLSVSVDIKKNATSAHLVKGGNGLQGFLTATPFPIPQGGLEIIWNHIARYRGGSVHRTTTQITPTSGGQYIPVVMRQWLTYRDKINEADSGSPENILFYYMQAITAPARLSGNVLLIHETLDQVKEPRRAWIYTAGQRRVRRAPQVSYDGPAPGAEGQRVADNLDMYNGSPGRYDWRLIGKRELYIPYNDYKLQSSNLRYADIIAAKHIQSDLVRYELHRVWVVEGALKKGERHIYAKRVMYVDEDTWQIVLADHYDSRGELWRVAEGFMTQVYDKQIPWLSAEVIYDLLNGRYMVSGLRNEEKTPMEFGAKSSLSEYTPSTLRKMGIR